MSDPLWLVGAVDAVQRVPVVRVQVNPASAHRIVSAAFNIVGKRAEPPLLTLRRRPAWPFLLPTDFRDPGPSLRILAYDHAVTNRLFFREHVVEKTRIGRLRSSPALPSGEIERFDADRRGESMPAGRAGSPAAGGRVQ